MRVPFLLLGTTVLFGCASAIPIVRSAAVEDFQCPAERVGVARMGSGLYRALGCGQRAIYECAIADGYVCTMEAEIQAVETSDQVADVQDSELTVGLRACDLGPIQVDIEFDADGSATSLEFSDVVSSRQRSCVAHVAADHVGSPGVVHYPPRDVPVQAAPVEIAAEAAPVEAAPVEAAPVEAAPDPSNIEAQGSAPDITAE